MPLRSDTRPPITQPLQGVGLRDSAATVQQLLQLDNSDFQMLKVRGFDDGCHSLTLLQNLAKVVNTELAGTQASWGDPENNWASLPLAEIEVGLGMLLDKCRSREELKFLPQDRLRDSAMNRLFHARQNWITYQRHRQSTWWYSTT